MDERKDLEDTAKRGQNVEPDNLGAWAFARPPDLGEEKVHVLAKFFDGRPQQNGFRTRAQIPTQSAKSVALSKGLKDRGFKFCGPTIVYAFCQATGMVNDHLVSCWRHESCAALAQA